MISVTMYDQAYEVYSWEEIGNLTYTLASSILNENHSIDRLIALARGGVSIAQSTADFLGVHNISVIQMESYSKLEKKQEPIITQSIAVDITGEHVLIIDDLVDTGESLVFAKKYVESLHPASVKTATITTKPWTTIKPDFSVLETKAWIIYPWETRETITTLNSMWKQKQIPDIEIRQNLSKLGFSDTAVSQFLEIDH